MQTEQPTLRVTLTDADGHVGRGEACGIPYQGETPETMTGQIEAVRDAITAGMDRARLLDLLPGGGARFAVDSALWDLDGQARWRQPVHGRRVTAAPGGGGPDPSASAPGRL